MRISALIVGGVVAGAVIILGEVPLNFWLLAEEWSAVATRLSLPQPSAAVAVQGVIKLLLLGVFAVWLAQRLQTPSRLHASLLAGGIVWVLVWAWVQWGMLLAGYVTPKIMALTLAWGYVELPFATWVGMVIFDRMNGRRPMKPALIV
ncbi:MAG TPA: hypothetical protein VNA21_14345 [Steroidobacteraceae bacterium]|nr:hypothetical protein [Steroidobacteraceae bacterium]